MKKRTFLILTLISIIAMVAGTAMTSNAPRSIRFVGAQFIEGKGAVFHFETTGEFKHTSGGDATFVSYSWQFGKAVDEQTTIPITAEEFMVILEQHGWNILNKCVTDPSGLAIPVG